MNLYEKKIACYLINLDRAEDRLANILPVMKQLGIQFEKISAVDGRELSVEEINSIVDIETYKKYFKMSPEPGTVGCSLSHEKAWKKFLESNKEFALIFEDDVDFNPSQLLEIIKASIEKKKFWDILSFEVNHHGCPVKISVLPDGVHSLVTYLTIVRHAGAYMLTRKAAEKLLEKFYPIKMPVDHYFLHLWKFNLKFCGIEPRIVEQKFGDSYIKISKKEKIKNPRILLSNVIFNARTAVMHFFYNFYQFIIKTIA